MREEQLISGELPTQQALRMTAADWLQRLNDDAISDTEISDWLKWYREDEAHRQAFDRAELLFRKLRLASPAYKEMIRQTLTVHGKIVQPTQTKLRTHR